MSVIGSNVLAGASGGAGAAGFAIERSLRFNSGDSSFLNRTPSAAGNRKTWTWSAWVKFTNFGQASRLFAAGADNDNRTIIHYDTSDNSLKIYSTVGGVVKANLKTVAAFRDPSAFYHVVVSFDAANTTASIYINGVSQSLTVSTAVVNENQNVNNNVAHKIGQSVGGTVQSDFYLAECILVDGQALAATDFGETDDNGVWQPKKFAGTYGTNGFHLDFADNSSNAALGTDTSGNSNTWTVNNLTANVPPPSSSFTWTGSLLSGTGGSGNAGGYSGSYFQIPAGTSSWDLHNETDGNTGFWFSDSQSQVAGHPPDQNGNFVALRNNGSGTASTGGSGFSSTGFPTDSMDGDPRWYFTVNRTTGAGTVKVGPSGTVYNFTVPTTGNVYFHVNAYGAYNYNLGYGDPSNQDSLVDTPTNGDTASGTGAGGEITGNYATLNPLDKGSNITLSNGNLDVVKSSTTWANAGLRGTFGVSSGKYYWEITKNNSAAYTMFGVAVNAASFSESYGAPNNETWTYISNSGNKLGDNDGGAGASYGASFTTGDVIGVALDMDAGTLVFYKNGVSQGTAFSTLSGKTIFPWIHHYNNADASICNFGQRAFAYAAPSGYKSLNTANLPTPTIADGSKYFDTKLYTSNSSSLSVAGYEFSPSFVWIKNRASAQMHGLFDVVRGANQFLSSNRTNAEHTTSGSGFGTGTFNSFDSNGFTLGDDIGQNSTNYPSGEGHVAWAWDAGANSGKTYTVTVSGGDFYIDGAQQPTLTLAEGSTYKFDQSASTNATHPLRFSTTSDGTHGGGSEYTTGVTTAGTPGSAGAYTQIVIAASAPTLYAYCTNHSGMGFQVNTSDKGGSTIVAGSLNSSTYIQSATYSTYIYGSSPTNTANAFDGSTSTYCQSQSGTNKTLEFLPSPAITFTSKLEVYCAISAANTTASWNGNSVTPVAGQWVTIFSGSGTIDGIDSLVINTNGSSSSATISAIRVDGKILVDSGATPPNVPSIASQVMANPTAGFSIVSVTEDAHADGGTVGHGLNAKPAMIWEKRRDATAGWYVQHSGLGDMSGSYLVLNDTAAKATDNTWNLAEPTASVMSIDPGYLNGNTNADVIYYCFAPVAGYSAFGSWDSNNSANGNFVYLGFKPRWLMVKGADNVGDMSYAGWLIIDTERNPYNVCDASLYADDAKQEGQRRANTDPADFLDILSNGFKIRFSGTETSGASNQTFIYAAFASNSFASNGGLAR